MANISASGIVRLARISAGKELRVNALRDGSRGEFSFSITLPLVVCTAVHRESPHAPPRLRAVRVLSLVSFFMDAARTAKKKRVT